MLSIPFNFTFFQQYGAFVRDEEIKQSIIANLQLILETLPGECTFLPNYGNPLLNELLKNNNEVLVRDLESAISSWEPRLKSVTVSFPQGNFEESADLRELIIRGLVSDEIKPFEQVFNLKLFSNH